MRSIRVAIRVRPSLNLAQTWVIDPANNNIQQVGSSTAFSFNRVYSPTTNTYSIYQEMASDIVDSVMTGTNGTIFAYGSTGSGKTYTMMGEAENPGITPLAVDHIFKYIEDHPERDFVVGYSYFEIYNEKVRDLLKEGSLAESRIKFSQEVAESAQELTDTIIASEANRATGSTSMNEHSSRSHAIVRIQVDSYERGGDEGVKLSSVLNLVDLAGSECQKNTNAEGDRQHEASMINKSLLALSKLIDSLQNGKSIAVYRESKLTLYLQNSIGGNALTAIICAINGDFSQRATSEYTLRFASKAMKVKNQPKVNRIVTDKCRIEELLKENMMLKQKILEYEERDCVQRSGVFALEAEESSGMAEEDGDNDPKLEIPKRITGTRSDVDVQGIEEVDQDVDSQSDDQNSDSDSEDSLDFSQSMVPIDFVPVPIQLPKRVKKVKEERKPEMSKDEEDELEDERQAQALSREILAKNSQMKSSLELPEIESPQRDERQRMTALLSEIESLKAQLENMSREKEELLCRITDTEAVYEQQEKDWADKMDGLRKTMEERQAFFEASSAHNSETAERLREKDSVISDLKMEIQGLKTKLTRTEAELKGSAFTQSIIKNKMEQKDLTIIQLGERIQAQKVEIENSNAQIRSQSDTIMKLQNQNDAFLAEISELAQSHAREMQQQRDIQQDYERKIEDFAAAKTKIEYSSVATMTTVSNNDVSLMSASITQLTDRLSRQEKKPVQSKIPISSYATEIAKLKQKTVTSRFPEVQTQTGYCVRCTALQNIDPNTILNRAKQLDEKSDVRLSKSKYTIFSFEGATKIDGESQTEDLEVPEEEESLEEEEQLSEEYSVSEEEEESEFSYLEPNIDLVRNRYYVDHFMQVTGLLIQILFFLYYQFTHE